MLSAVARMLTPNPKLLQPHNIRGEAYISRTSNKNRSSLLDFQNVRPERHVVKAGRDLGQPREDEESSESKGGGVSRAVLEVRGVVRACFPYTQRH